MPSAERATWLCACMSDPPHVDAVCCASSVFAVDVSTVGMPVTRHPPYSPGRAVFPHPVLRLYSLPRCKAEPSSTHAPTWNLRNTRTHYLDVGEDVGARLL